jgi:hypothetical protein
VCVCVCVCVRVCVVVVGVREFVPMVLGCCTQEACWG